jgi:aspartokinase
MVKDRLKGINISPELVLLNIFGLEDFFILVTPLFQALKKHKINTPFLSVSFPYHERPAVSCCFTKEDIKLVNELIQKNETLKMNAQFVHGVGLLSVFPHHSSLNILNLSISALKDAKLSLLGMSSSISALIFVLKYNQLGKAVDSLKCCLF